MIIDHYASLDEKSHHFQCETIETKEQLDHLINRLTIPNNSSNLIFRGLTEAKYKLYTSGQRNWKGLELYKLGKSYKDLIQTEINKAKAFQNNLLTKFYLAFGHLPYDLSILSFLQHYGAPTPLLDFTYNFECALFFGIDGLKHNPSVDIENYFSIYAIDTNWAEFIPITTHLASITSQIDNIYKNYPNANGDEILGKIETLDFSYFSDLTLFYLPGYTKGGMPFGLSNMPSFKLIYNQHNLYIINQEGLLVFNASPDHPLEDFFKGRDSISFDNTFSIPKILCWNIHKSFDEYIKRYLNTVPNIPIDKNFIYPQEDYIAKKAFEETKNLI